MKLLLCIAVVALACDDGAVVDSQHVARGNTAVEAGVDAPDTSEAPAETIAPADSAPPEETVAPDTTVVADTAPDGTADSAPDPDTSVVEGDTAPADTSVVEGDTVPADTTPADTSPDGDTTPDPAEGTPDDPILVARFPFVVADDTRTSPSSVLDRYTCAATTDESGPERVYRFDITAAGTFVAEVDEDDGVDVDVHLLDVDPATAAPGSVACRARHNTKLTAALGPGRYWLVVDTYVGAAGAKPGAYRVALEHTVIDAWQIVELAPGVTWKQKVYADYAGGRQTINTLDVDLAHPAVSIRPHGGDGCIRPSRVGPAEGAVAAINAGFFDTGPGTCPPLDLIKIEGELVAPNRLTGAAQRSIGVDADGHAIIAWVAANSDWPEAFSAVGSYPSLVTDGAIRIEPDKDTNFFDGRHPRTALGLTGDGRLLMVTVDGRGPAGLGMTLNQLAQHLVNLGAEHGVNLDGGGSTAMWCDGQSLTGIVNFPSDGDGASHTGDRAVSDVLLVFSTP